MSKKRLHHAPKIVQITASRQKQLRNFSCSLTAKQTEAELRFGFLIRNLGQTNQSFSWKAQQVFHIAEEVAFIADFFFPGLRIAVEIDGKNHKQTRQSAYDTWRDQVLLAKRKIHTLRLSNEFVLRHPQEVRQAFAQFIVALDRVPLKQKRYISGWAGLKMDESLKPPSKQRKETDETT